MSHVQEPAFGSPTVSQSQTMVGIAGTTIVTAGVTHAPGPAESRYSQPPGELVTSQMFADYSVVRSPLARAQRAEAGANGS